MDRSFKFPVSETFLEVIVIPLSDLTTALTTGTNKGYFRAKYNHTIAAVYLDAFTAPTTSGIAVTIKKNSASIFNTKLTIDATLNTSIDSSIKAVLSTTSGLRNDLYTFDIDAVGSGTAGAGLQATIVFIRT